MMKAGIYLLLLFPLFVSGQDGRGDFRFVFYNVENLFDPFNDSLTIDEEFLPGGMRHWTWDRFVEKENGIYKVLVSAGGWKPPELIGLCEVENRFVLNWLCRKTPLLKYNYRIIHQDSPDERGIDVALLYLDHAFRPLETRFFPVKELENPTRDMLYVRGLVLNRDTLHLFISHWPSRWEGYLESLPDRMAAARTLRGFVDSLVSSNPESRILIGGDLNDELSDPSLRDILRIQLCGKEIFDTCLYQTGNGKNHTGTLKYRGSWFEFDHLFVSGFFLRDSCLSVKPGGKIVYAPDFLLEADPSSTGERPFRTFFGYRYNGGFSDHLPVYIDIRRWE